MYRHSSISAVLISAIFDLTQFMILSYFLISAVMFQFNVVFELKDAYFSSEAILYVLCTYVYKLHGVHYHLGLPPRIHYRGLSWITRRYLGPYTLIILLQYLIRNLRNMMKLTGIIALLGFLGAHLSVSMVSRQLHYLTLSFLYQRIPSLWGFKSNLKVSY